FSLAAGPLVNQEILPHTVKAHGVFLDHARPKETSEFLHHCHRAGARQRPLFMCSGTLLPREAEGRERWKRVEPVGVNSPVRSGMCRIVASASVTPPL